jgi:hypothetical protein
LIAGGENGGERDARTHASSRHQSSASHNSLVDVTTRPASSGHYWTRLDVYLFVADLGGIGLTLGIFD